MPFAFSTGQHTISQKGQDTGQGYFEGGDEWGGSLGSRSLSAASIALVSLCFYSHECWRRCIGMLAGVFM